MSTSLTFGEKQEATLAIRRALQAGYAIKVWEGEDWALSEPSTDETKIIGALGSTGSDQLYFVDLAPHNGHPNKIVGWVLFVYGNCPDGKELCADWSDNTITNKIVEYPYIL